MIHVNDNFLKLSNNYLFAEIARKVAAYKAANPDKRVISLGIGDVTQPLCPAVIEAMHKAVDEMSVGVSFRGYGPEHGYDFLRKAICEYDYRARGVEIDESEVFINDGAKSDTSNIGDILHLNNRVLMTDPIYPVYLDSNIMSGRAGDKTESGWTNVTYMPCNKENNFKPVIPAEAYDIVYLCYPNNPIGSTLNRAELEKWVEYALQNKCLIMYDSAYEAYIQEDDVPHSIYEIEGAKKCAIEFRSYSKTAGFTGVRCGYTVVPKELEALDKDGNPVQLNHLWERRQGTKFNGASYISQRGAEAIYTEEGRKQVKQTIAYYMNNAKIMRETLTSLGFEVFGGQNAPYLWVKTPNGEGSWELFEKLLHEAAVVCTPGVGFGPSGDGYVRLTAFGNADDCKEAIERIKALF